MSDRSLSEIEGLIAQLTAQAKEARAAANHSRVDLSGAVPIDESAATGAPRLRWNRESSVIECRIRGCRYVLLQDLVCGDPKTTRAIIAETPRINLEQWTLEPTPIEMEAILAYTGFTLEDLK